MASFKAPGRQGKNYSLFIPYYMFIVKQSPRTCQGPKQQGGSFLFSLAFTRIARTTPHRRNEMKLTMKGPTSLAAFSHSTEPALFSCHTNNNRLLSADIINNYVPRFTACGKGHRSWPPE